MREESPTFLLFLIPSATAIPNATVTWWFRGKEIGRSGAGATDLDRNFDVRGHGENIVVVVMIRDGGLRHFLTIRPHHGADCNSPEE